MRNVVVVFWVVSQSASPRRFLQAAAPAVDMGEELGPQSPEGAVAMPLQQSQTQRLWLHPLTLGSWQASRSLTGPLSAHRRQIVCGRGCG